MQVSVGYTKHYAANKKENTCIEKDRVLGVENADVHQCYPSASLYMHLWNKFEKCWVIFRP